MAKVFAVVKSQQGDLELLSWASAAQFMKEGNSFLDERFIYVATTDDHKNMGMFQCGHENPDKAKGHFGVALSREQLKAHKMMCDAFKSHFKR